MVTGDEVISDSYDLKVIDDTVYEVDCRKITLGADNIGPSFLPLVASYSSSRTLAEMRFSLQTLAPIHQQKNKRNRSKKGRSK